MVLYAFIYLQEVATGTVLLVFLGIQFTLYWMVLYMSKNRITGQQQGFGYDQAIAMYTDSPS